MGNYNDVLLEQLADNGNGIYAYVDTLDEARARLRARTSPAPCRPSPRTPRSRWSSTRRVVQRYRLLGYENRDVADQDFRNDTGRRGRDRRRPQRHRPV